MISFRFSVMNSYNMDLSWPDHRRGRLIRECHAIYTDPDRRSVPYCTGDTRRLDADVFLRSAGAGQTVTTYRPTEVIFSQGDVADSVPKQEMIRLLHENHGFSDRFIAHMLARNIRIEEDLVDQLFNSSEKRLARALLLLARYGKPEETHRVLPRISQETLAEMIGTTHSRVNFFMNKFKKLGFIEYNGGLKVNHSLLTVIVHE